MSTTDFDRKKHWENIYQHKKVDEVSWYQPTPTTSLELIEGLDLPHTDKIIDIGGGDSFLVDHLLERRYEDLTVLDISEAAIQRAQQRLDAKANAVNWVVSDVTELQPSMVYDLWHDRAAFHFLTESQDIEQYLSIVSAAVKPGGYLIIGTFSEEGPTKCSGIDIKQYSATTLSAVFNPLFETVKCMNVNHETPFSTTQNFTFCVFERRGLV